MAYSGSQYTRLGLYGGARSLYGSFAGKAEAAVWVDIDPAQTPSYTSIVAAQTPSWSDISPTQFAVWTDINP